MRTPAGGGLTVTRTVTITGGTIAPIDHVIMDNLRHPTFVTIGEINTRFAGFGGAWWAAASGSGDFERSSDQPESVRPRILRS